LWFASGLGLGIATTYEIFMSVSSFLTDTVWNAMWQTMPLSY